MQCNPISLVKKAPMKLCSEYKLAELYRLAWFAWSHLVEYAFKSSSLLLFPLPGKTWKHLITIRQNKRYGYFRSYRPRKVQYVTWIVQRPSITNVWKTFCTPYRNTPSAPTTTPYSLKLKQSRKCGTRKWSEQDLSHRADRADSQVVLPTAPYKVINWSDWRFSDFLLYHTEPHGKARSHVSIQDIECRKKSSTTLCSTIRLYAILYKQGVHVIWFLFLRQIFSSHNWVLQVSGPAAAWTTRISGT